VEEHFEQLERVWEERYQAGLGYWRSFVNEVICKYLECGDPHFGFARVKCEECNHEYLLAFSCKCRHFCPSCHQKRVVEFGQWLYTEVLKKVPHRQWVFSIPKRLRIYFMYERRLLAKLSQCAWKVLALYLQRGVPIEGASPGAVVAVQTFGDFLNFNPHLHIIATEGCFDDQDGFMVGPQPDPKALEQAFRLEVFKMLKKEGKILSTVIDNMLSWHNSGFNIFCSRPTDPNDQNGLERLAQYIIRAPISQERMVYIPASQAADGLARVIYQAKDGGSSKTFLTLDWLAQLVSHIPGKGEQMVRYYGYYSNKSRGMRKKAALDEQVPYLIDTDIESKELRKSWSRLIQKVYGRDPLICPKCSGKMKVIALIDDLDVIKKILLHLDLWETRNHDPPPGKIMRNYIPEKELRIKQLDFTGGLQYPDIDTHYSNRYEDDYSQLPDEEVCLKLSTSR
jgi:hypothetical protein